MKQLNAIYRKRWQENRFYLEEKGLRAFPLHEDRKIPRRDPMAILFRIFAWALRLTPFYKWGLKNAQKISPIENRLTSSKIGKGSIRILHLSDLHLDECPVSQEDILWAIKESGPYDFACITGDLSTGWPIDEITKNKVREIIKALKPKYKTFFILGNHDSGHIVPYLENQGVEVLTNQIATFPKDGILPCPIEFVGTDDPHYFYQKDALRILQEGKRESFRVGLIHTPELYKEAQQSGIDLYLCGHTHGGQIALPGGIPIIRRVYRGKRFAKGPWRYSGMLGYTSSGVGTSSMPIRFFTTAEVIIHEVVPRSEG